MMTNAELLNGRIELSGIKKGKIAKTLGITRTALWQKINNKREFKASEISTICSMLGITSLQEKDQIFFAE